MTYKELVRDFFDGHDPTTMNSQGPDHGTQYRSGIFFRDKEQEKIAREEFGMVRGRKELLYRFSDSARRDSVRKKGG